MTDLSDFTFRRARMEDLMWITDIEVQVQETPWSLSIMQISLMTDEYFYVAECINAKDYAGNGNPFLGFLVANVLPPTADINNFGVHPRAQNRGLGQAFINHFCQQMVEKSIEELRLEVRVSNDRALALYQKNGFVITARRKNYYDLADRRGKEDGLLMTKYLVG